MRSALKDSNPHLSLIGRASLPLDERRNGRGDRIRTCILSVPDRALLAIELHPDVKRSRPVRESNPPRSIERAASWPLDERDDAARVTPPSAALGFPD